MLLKYSDVVRVQVCSVKNIFFCLFKPTTKILPIKTEKTLIKSEFFCGYIFFVAF